MRVVVTGATGNVGTSVVQALSAEPEVGSVVGVARRVPEWTVAKTEWVAADVAVDDLAGHLVGADAVVHLAWLFQPTRNPWVTWRTNVRGSLRVFHAVAEAGVPALVYASSVGTYCPGPEHTPVAEDWPTDGLPTAAYCREKAYVERALDVFERDHPGIRVVRLRPGFIFKRESASQQRRLFAGPFLPYPLVRPGLLPVVPDVPGLRFQALHTEDAAAAYRQAVLRPVRGAFNIAADPVIDPARLAGLLHARTVPVPAGPVRALVAAAWGWHLVPASPQLFDAVLRLPIMDTARARTELGWQPGHTATDAISEFLRGLREGAGLPTPPLTPGTAGFAHELATGAGSRP